MAIKQKLSPCLWFDGQAEQAAEFYVSIFENSRVTSVSRYGDAGPGPKGSAMVVTFELERLAFMALNGGPMFKFTEAISIKVDCESQAEVDRYWEKLTADGGKPGRCAWLKDKFGLSWQIVPSRLVELMQSPDQHASQRVMSAMLKMSKIDISELERAHAGGA
jgi:predicted 3-demethylubiquinone-9 3-methyltransferase (glyoxalase superfamily)